MTALYLKQPGQRPVAVSLGLIGRSERAAYLAIEGRGLPRLELAGNPIDMVDTLKTLIEQISPRLGDEAGVIYDQGGVERYGLIQLEDLPTDNPDQCWWLIYERFKHSIPDVAELIFKEHLKGKDLAEMAAAEARPPSQVESDLATVEAAVERADLIDEAGQPVWGHQTRIAEALGIPNAGSSNRRRIKAVARALVRKEAA